MPMDVPLVPIGPAGAVTSLSYYNTTPESPSGQAVPYALFDRPPESPKQPGGGSLWICRPDGTDHQRVVCIESLTVHNAACQQWVDERTIAYQDGRRVHVVGLDGQAKIEPVPGLLEHESHEGKVLVSLRRDEPGTLPGACEVDIRTGQRVRICTPADFAIFRDRFPADYRPDPADWQVLHLQYNPSGTRMAMRFDMGPGEPFRYVMTCDLDGGNPACFGPKPMHFVWFDDETLMGHDHQVRNGLPDDRHLRRYRPDGSAVETLAGPGNHLGASPDRDLFASESWYHAPIVRLQVYRRGETAPTAVIAEHDRAETVWGLTFQVNPSFSREGRRVYFNHVGADGMPRAMAAQVDACR